METQEQAEADNLTNHSAQTPAVIITIGEFSAHVARSVKQIYLRGNSKRKNAASFFQLCPGGEESLCLEELVSLPMSDPNVTPVEAEKYLEQRLASFENGIKAGLVLQQQLKKILYEQRIHERLISAGWNNPDQVPLNIFILTDLKDPFAAGTLIPMATVLNDYLATDSLCRAHWLISTAAYPDDCSECDMEVWSLLYSFDKFLHFQSEERKLLAAAMKLNNERAPEFGVYLFDNRKQGSAMVENAQTLGILIGNALFALLQNNFAGELIRTLEFGDLQDKGTFFSTIGAVSIIYDPQSLQVACSSRIGAHFLDEKIFGLAVNGQACLEAFNQVKEQIGNIYTWLNRLTWQLPTPVGQAQINLSQLTMSLLLNDIHLSKPDYEKLNQTGWANEIRAYHARFNQINFPDIVAAMLVNHSKLVGEINELLNKVFDGLPFDPRLYPGVKQNAEQVLSLIDGYLLQFDHDIDVLVKRVTQEQLEMEQDLFRKCDELQTLLDKLHPLPSFLKILPAFLRKKVAPIYVVWRQSRNFYSAQSLKNECVGLLQLCAGLKLELIALEHLRDSLPNFTGMVAQARIDLNVFINNISLSQQSFSSSWGEFPLGFENNEWDSLYRRPVVDSALAQWTYEKWTPDLDQWLNDFLNDENLYGNWRQIKPDVISAWVQDHGMQAFLKTWDMNLDEISHNFESHPVQPGKVADVLSSNSFTACANAAIPPLRPDFDAVGGAGSSALSCYKMIGDDRWDLCARFSLNGTKASSMKLITTEDLYTVNFLQVCNRIPLLSLVASFGPARTRLAGLAPEQRRRYDLIQSMEASFSPVIDTTDPDDPNLIRKIFSWKVKPKGSDKEIEQTIELPISPSRFEFYRRLPRYNGQWNLYAEKDMPEIRNLAREFQKLHERRKWSTYNQAYNVLKFVQTCVPYSYDKDTTGHEDWARYPIETLMETTGDCEDVAILCAAVIARLGFQVVMLLYPRHLAFGVAGADRLKGDYVVDPKTGLKYYYGEATADGWTLGQIPDHYANLTPDQILPVNILIEDGEG